MLLNVLLIFINSSLTVVLPVPGFVCCACLGVHCSALSGIHCLGFLLLHSLEPFPWLLFASSQVFFKKCCGEGGRRTLQGHNLCGFWLFSFMNKAGEAWESRARSEQTWTVVLKVMKVRQQRPQALPPPGWAPTLCKHRFVNWTTFFSSLICSYLNELVCFCIEFLSFVNKVQAPHCFSLITWM